MAFHDDFGIASLNSQNWFLGTGATNHATPNIFSMSASEEYIGTDNRTSFPISSFC